MGPPLPEYPWARLDLLRIRETAALLALSTRTIPRSIVEGKLKGSRVAGEKVLRIKRVDVDPLLEPLGDGGQASD